MSEPRWLSETEREAWVQFAAVLELLPSALDSQLVHDEQLTHFEYFLLAMLSEAEGRTLRMSELASRTNSTLPRLSKVVNRLEAEGYVERVPSPNDRRATNAVMTDAGWAKIVGAAPGHVENVRSLVFDQLSAEQVEQLSAITHSLMKRLDPEGRMRVTGRAR
ncbi:MarR family transcriptional regulator [Cnuibacter physcomitrellae]|uniref:MarR family transcriptional regulator n=1 Tax=Cnuibacter physcomitrellae TaxID=1619308 RepID=A0A1X9LX12_9MICO|nr:MarR family transcriptional regulator [Cnuibacter physcomitrellae]ARJ06590.1 MarR family transcriptional regulator [Cnuibacter physcomitrellae]GGI38365.1 MarR family transcriptional regulator [Cnuibacter physcomitrellae]